MKISNRISDLKVSPIRKLIPYSEKCEEKGINVIKLNIGQPDIETPKQYIEAIANYKDKVLAYSHSRGSKEFINSVIKYYNKFGIDFEYDDIIATQGASEALTFVMMALCDFEDEIIVIEPFYANYRNFSDIVTVNLIPVTSTAEEGFRINCADDFDKIITPRTKAILIANPSNPTGRVYTKEELDIIADVAVRNDLFIISDEVYKEFNYTDRPFISFASYKDISNRVIIVDSISKRYSCCGARIGNIASKNNDVIEGIMKLAQSRLSVPTLDQAAAATLENVEPEYMENVLRLYRERRDILSHRLSNMDGVICDEPEGAFYCIAKLPVDNAEKFVIWLLENIAIDDNTILITPAKDFYSSENIGHNEVRISYCVDAKILSLGMDILERALKEYPDKTN